MITPPPPGTNLSPDVIRLKGQFCPGDKLSHGTVSSHGTARASPMGHGWDNSLRYEACCLMEQFDHWTILIDGTSPPKHPSVVVYPVGLLLSAFSEHL